jgi:hypothetical protein
MPRRRVDPVHFQEYCLMIRVIAAINGFLSGVVPELGGSCTYFSRVGKGREQRGRWQFHFSLLAPHY